MLLYRIAGCVIWLMLLIPASVFSTEKLTLADAVNMALANNPKILAGQGDLRAAQVKAKGAGALANPEILVTPGVTGSSPTDQELFVSQPLEINGARSARKKVAGAESQAVAAGVESVMRDVVRDTKIAYWNTVYARVIVDLNRENVKMNEALYAAAKRQVEVGTAPGSNVVKAQLELDRAKQELVQAESEYSRAMAALTTLLGRAPGAEFELADELTYVPVEYDAAKLASSALSNRPEIQESQAKIEARKGEVDAAKAARRPDLAVQARRETFGGPGGLALGFSLPIFDWGSNKAERQAAQESVKAEEQRLAAVRSSVSLEVQNAVARLVEADTLVKSYDQGILAQSQRLVEMAQKGYKTGATSYLEVLEAQRTLRAVRTDYYSALAEHAKARAELEWAAAVVLPTSVEVKK